ncbi:uncharacterized protein EDB91DRAFT_1116144 [Suillus paluster]|uniref:uncharacterized protein n=1 Tax=Suillus paluster TaxID=48578 RepID=UPI001B864C8D|nr:uncharacterized protein EDB91DRAFT_1116144 [Suillus paluster]KAG1747082.1 hypothetical protein EDB91DRAFT_1116144 [Suillus paluster]
MNLRFLGSLGFAFALLVRCVRSSDVVTSQTTLSVVSMKLSTVAWNGEEKVWANLIPLVVTVGVTLVADIDSRQRLHFLRTLLFASANNRMQEFEGTTTNSKAKFSPVADVIGAALKNIVHK